MKQDWLSILNEVYNVQVASLEELQSRFANMTKMVVQLSSQEGASWARYYPQDKTLIGNNGHVIFQASNEDDLWWGASFTHQNQKDPVVSKGDWLCCDGFLNNRHGSKAVVRGIVPKSAIIRFLEWQPSGN